MAADRLLDINTALEGLAPAQFLPDAQEEVEGLWKKSFTILGSVAGTATAYTAVASPVFTSDTLVAGVGVLFIPHVTCGAQPTLALDGLTAKEIKDRNGENLPSGALLASTAYPLWCTGSVFRLAVSWEAISGNYNWAHAVFGLDGNALGGLHQDGTFYPIDDPLPALDARNRAHADQVGRRIITQVAAIDADDNGIFSNGQSNEQGPEAWPVFTGANGPTWSDPDGLAGGTPGVVMMGNDVRPTVASTAGFDPLGTNQYNNAVGVARDNDAVMTQAQQAALAQGTQRLSETAVLSAALQFKRFLDARRFLPFGDTTRRLVVAATGVGGKSLGQLMDGNPQDGTPDYFQRFVGATQMAFDLSDNASREFRLAAILVIQGESDMLGTGIHSNRAEFKAARSQWYDDMQAEAMAITGQPRPPAIFQVLPSHTYARALDQDGNADFYVPNADMELADERGDVFTIGPYYNVTDKSEHLDANGTRWIGAKAGQVMARVLLDRRGWEPLRPLWIERRGLIVDVGFNVPQPPLQISSVYKNGVAFDALQSGFRITDQVGLITATVEVVAPTILRLTLASLPRGGGLLYYACHGDVATIAGNGNISDSESADPLTIYKYISGSGMDADENIAALNDQPYDMRNWLVPFAHPLGWEL